MPETGILLKEPLFLLAWERAQRGGVPFQALGVQGGLMVIRRGFWSEPWYGEYQWLASGPGRREEIFAALERDGKAPGEPHAERFDLQYQGSPEFPSARGLLITADPSGIRLEAREKTVEARKKLPKVPAAVKSYAEASEILDAFQAEFDRNCA